MHIPPLVVPLIAGIAVYIDAKAVGIRKGLMPGFFNMGAGMWGLACFLFLIIALPAYLLKRNAYKQIIAQLQVQALPPDGHAPETSPEVWPPPPQPPPGMP